MKQQGTTGRAQAESRSRKEAPATSKNGARPITRPRAAEPLRVAESVVLGDDGAKATTRPQSAVPPSPNGKPAQHTDAPWPTTSPPEVAAVSAELVDLQRQRAIVIKSRNMQANRIQAIIAGTLGYCARMEEKDRRKLFSQASELIDDVVAGKVQHRYEKVITTTMIGIKAFEAMKENLEDRMTELARKLPVISWVEHEDRSGFSPLGLAIVVGEAGDLGTYANPAKVWRRFSCAPWSFEGKTLMGATWRVGKEGKLPTAEWTNYGYSPRRRSIAYLIGENIVKQNYHVSPDAPKRSRAGKPTLKELKALGKNSPEYKKYLEEKEERKKFLKDGPYRARYTAVRERVKEVHPDWTDLRQHRHAMLLATKMLLRDLWVVWTGAPAEPPPWN
jgi:hypothetical protein